MSDRAHGRKIAFAAFVRKALDDARATRAWTGTEVSRRTGVSRQTINRWVRGEWASDPEAERVVAFCRGLGLDPSVAFGVLGWDRTAPSRPAPSAPPMDPDVEALLRRLVDPNVSDAESSTSGKRSDTWRIARRCPWKSEKGGSKPGSYSDGATSRMGPIQSAPGINPSR